MIAQKANCVGSQGPYPITHLYKYNRRKYEECDVLRNYMYVHKCILYNCTCLMRDDKKERKKQAYMFIYNFLRF